MNKPFDNAADLLGFLEAHEPERYVFRGQTRVYDGPVLPSGLRDRFTPFNTSSAPSEWAGISFSTSVIADEVAQRRQDASTREATGKDVDDGKTTWDLPEAIYQRGFREFFNKPHCDQISKTGNILRESAVPATSALLGGELADFLCQQYGFTSTALDVSTDPAVAIFFATHGAPLYGLMADSPHLGVVYRWPRERATIGEELLLKLEGANYQSVTTSFRNFIHDNTDLKVVTDTLMRYTSTTDVWHKRMMTVVAEDERRAFGALRFPTGAFARSRMGRQGAALLSPAYEVVQGLRPRHDGDLAALVGDLLKTHQGEAFHFRHGGSAPAERLNKFTLWPSFRSIDGRRAADLALELGHDHLEFEDLYLEMMLRFFSSCSPCDIILAKLLEPGNRKSLYGIGVAHGVVDLGYQLHPSDAGGIATSLNLPEIYMPIPTMRHIPANNLEPFRAAFAAAVALER